MNAYTHRDPARVSRAEAAKSHTVYNKALAQAELILSRAREQGHQIRQAALVEAERDARAIREAARAEGLALANTEFAASEHARKEIGRKRLAEATNEIYGLKAPEQ